MKFDRGVRNINKIFSIALIVVFTIIGVSPAFVEADSLEDIVVVDSSTSKSILEEGDVFNLILSIKNITSDKNINIIALDFSSAKGVDVVDGSSRVSKNISINVGNTEGISTSLVYRGEEQSTIPITIYYEVAGTVKSLTTTEKIRVESEETDTTPSKPANTSIYEPRICLTEIPKVEIKPGENQKVNLEILNNSTHYAKEVEISVSVNEEDQKYFYIKDKKNFQIDKIDNKKTEEISFNIIAERFIKKGTYPITLEYKYKNFAKDEFTNSDTLYLEVTDELIRPRLQFDIQKQLGVGNITPGSKYPLNIRLNNLGEMKAENIRIEVQGLKSDGVSVIDGSNVSYITELDGGKFDYINHRIYVSPDLNQNAYPLTIVYNYEDEEGNKYNETQQLFLQVDTNNKGNANIVIKDILSPTNEININEDFKIKFNLENTSNVDAENVKINISPENQIIPKSQSIIKLNELKAKETKELEFILAATDNAKSRNYPINIIVEYDTYENGNEVKTSFEQYTGVNIVNNSTNKSVPKIIVGEYKTTPTIVKAGDTFNLEIGFYNTHSVKNVNNIKAYLTVNEETNKSGSVFSPVNASNTFYINNIEPGKVVKKQLEMYTVPDATPKTYSIIVNIEYEDESGEGYTATDYIGIPVQQQTKVELGKVTLEDTLFSGRNTYISSNVFNSGRTDVRNLMITVEGDFGKRDVDKFIGEFQRGKSEYYEAMIIPQKVGELTGEVVVTYEELSGEAQEIRRQFSANVVEAPKPNINMNEENMNKMGQEAGMTPDGQNSNKKKFIIGGIIGAAVIAFFIIRSKRRKRQEEMVFDE